MYRWDEDMDNRRCLIIIVLTAVSTNAYPHFGSRIPNGESVPHACKPNYMWRGVGHKNKNGGGERNPFGIDFYNAGKIWTETLCNKDSDGDGRTNGEELGDPNCLWSEGNVPEKLTEISHPGVCQPMNSAKCQGKNDWVDCSEEDFKCEAFQNDPANISINVAAPCGMELDDCSDIIGGWAVGSTGECFSDEIGFRIGQNGYKHGVLQFHWNNPELRSDYTDESGMILHYTSKRRVHDAGVLVTGTRYLRLPPQNEQVTVDALCQTLEIVNGPIYITRTLHHMHYLGRQMRIQQYRNGVKLRDITQEDDYNYDSPVTFRYANAIEIRYGDFLKTTCVYSTKSRTKTVFHGRGTYDEMCNGFLTFHPKVNLRNTRCLTWKTLDYFSIYQSEEIHKCRHWDFLLSSTTVVRTLKSRVHENCEQLTSCLSECLTVVKEIQKHPCMVGDIGDWIKEQVRVGQDSRINYQEMRAFYTAISTCDRKIEQERCEAMLSKSTSSRNSFLLMIANLLLIMAAKVTV